MNVPQLITNGVITEQGSVALDERAFGLCRLWMTVNGLSLDLTLRPEEREHLALLLTANDDTEAKG